MATRYDHPNAIVRRLERRVSSAGATSQVNAAFPLKALLKAVHLHVITAGTVTDFTQAIAQISGTATTALGTLTLGTATADTVSSLSVGTGNAPTGITLAADDIVRVTNAVDATGVYEIVYEYEVFHDAVLS